MIEIGIKESGFIDDGPYSFTEDFIKVDVMVDYGDHRDRLRNFESMKF